MSSKAHGEMHISDRLGDNDLLVKHIRSTSSVASRSGVFDAARVRQLAQIVGQVPELHLKILSSGKLKNHTMRVNAQGLEGSLRGRKDGYTFFGCKKHGTKKMAGVPRDIINDFIIPSKDKETERRHRGRHMQIEYNLERACYLVRDLGIGFGAFVRLDRPLELKDNNLLNMGESFIIVNLVSEKQTDEQPASGPANKLRLKLFGGPATGEVFYFTPNQGELEEEQTDVRIGRSNQCDVVIEDAVLSKLQAHIYFSRDRDCWILEDGSTNKPSLNGTWLYLNDDFEVYSGMTFKVNQVLFTASIVEQQ